MSREGLLKLLLSIVAMLRLGKAKRASLLVAELSLYVPESLKEGQVFLQACRDIKLGRQNHLPKAQFMDLIGQAYAFAQELLPSVRVPDDVVLPSKRARKICIGKSFDALGILQKEDLLKNLRYIHALAYDDVYALRMIRTIEAIHVQDSTLRHQPIILSNSYIPDDAIAQYATELGMQLILHRYILITRAPILTSDIKDYFRCSDVPSGFKPVGRSQRIEGSTYGILYLPEALLQHPGTSIRRWSVV